MTTPLHPVLNKDIGIPPCHLASPTQARRMQFENVTAIAEGNVYFDGKVISHSILLSDGSKKTLGVILPGDYHFGTAEAELMEIVAGSCIYVLDGTEDSKEVAAGSSFNVPANSGFTINVETPCHYVCSFLS